MDIVQVATLAAKECVRQHVGLDRVAMLIEGYQYVLDLDDYVMLADLMTLARIVEPSNKGEFRKGAVTFANGGPSTNPGSIEVQMVRLFSMLDKDTNAYDFVRAFELIHPFSDGNGRLGWLIYNQLKKTMDYPLPLPDFKF